MERYLADAFGVILPTQSVQRIAWRTTVEFIAPVYARQPRSINADALLSDADNEAIRQRQCMIARGCWASEDCGFGHSCSSDRASLARTEARDRHLVRRAFGTESSVAAVREALGALRSARPLHPAQKLQYLAVTHFLDRLEGGVDEMVTVSWQELAEELRARERQYRLGPITADSVRAAVEEFARSMAEDAVNVRG
ncbi:hypothetical protein PHK61_12800 [Actinomycetospora lutea]|uniref:hypothetical protein n=1 Tax=Actinomycetospora lutea TaxID=663604 RepID=UPI0023662D91|nr:hypothetical protein [Actinomycetospora lutea]MDD7939295.1 hypothetical protein [Actinomycetospora lutea]